MSADGFETELRSLLRDEAATAPVAMSIHDLRARAGSRPRGSWWLGVSGARIAAGAGLVAVVALAVIVGLGRDRNPSVAASQPAPSPTASSFGVPPASIAPNAPTPTPIPSFDAGTSGTVVVGRISGDDLVVVGVDPAGVETTLGTVGSISTLAPNSGYDNGAILLGPGGLAVIQVANEDSGQTRQINVLVQIGRPSHTIRTLPDGAPSFRADGSVVIRTIDGTDQTLLVDDAHPNGTPLPSADPAAAPVLWTGVERVAGAGGETLSNWCDDGPTGGTCGLQVVPAGATTGVEISPKAGQGVESAVWTMDGTSVLMLTSPAIWRWDGHASAKVGTLPSAVASQTGLVIVGQTPTEVLVSDGFSGVTVVPIDGSGAGRTIDGVLLQVIQ